MILFITRKYPPSVGGMQQLSYYMTTSIARHVPVHIIKWGGSQKWLPLFILYALVRALLVLGTKSVNLIHISDLALAPLGLFLRFVGRQPVVANAHGLDVVYPNRLYQIVIPACAKRLDFVICNSEHTRQQCLAQGIEARRTGVIPLGVNLEAAKLSLSGAEQSHWTTRWGLESRPKHILLTVGRLVPRKGVSFFVSQVLPRLAKRRSDWVYLIVGDGSERRSIEATVRDRRLDRVVRILGHVPDDELRAAYAMADLLVMPNVPVAGDSEGFGLVTLEARAAGLPVVAADLEGIRESIENEEDGLLVPPEDYVAYVQAIDRLLRRESTAAEAQRRRERVAARYAWPRIAARYLEVFRQVQTEYRTQRS